MPFSTWDLGGCNCPGGGVALCGCTTAPAILTITHSIFGVVGTVPSTGVTTITFPYAYPGLGACASVTINLLFEFTPSLCKLVSEWAVNATTDCPDPTGTAVASWDTSVSGVSVGYTVIRTVNCAPFAIVYSFTAITQGGIIALQGAGNFTVTLS